MYSSRPLGLAEGSEDLSAGGILMHGEMHGCLRHSRSTETHRSSKMPLGTYLSELRPVVAQYGVGVFLYHIA